MKVYKNAGKMEDIRPRPMLNPQTGAPIPQNWNADKPITAPKIPKKEVLCLWANSTFSLMLLTTQVTREAKTSMYKIAKILPVLWKIVSGSKKYAKKKNKTKMILQ